MTGIDYGFNSTNEVKYDKLGLPIGMHTVMVVSEEQEKNDKGIVLGFEIVSDGEHKGTNGKAWYMTKHENPKVANIARQNIKRIADATGREVSPSSPIKGRVLVIEVREQKNNPDYTEIFAYHPEGYKPEEKAPF